MKIKKLAILAISLFVLGCGQAESGNTQGSTAQANNEQAISDEKSTATEANEEAETDKPVLTFEANTIDGVAVNSAIFSESKLTMLNVWATYCNPCLNEMPDLGEIANSYDKAEFQMYGIISDVEEGNADGIATANELIAQTNANYPHLLLNESLYRNLVGGLTSVPTTFFVNQESEVVGYVVGAQSKESWEEIINEVLEDVEK